MSKATIRRTATVLTVVLVVIATIAVVGVFSWGRFAAQRVAHVSALSAVAVMGDPTDTDVENSLLRAGLDPKSLAAAGVSSNEVDTLVGNVRTWLTNNPTTLSSADADYEDARSERDRLHRLVQSGQGTNDDVTALATAEGNLAQAETDRQSALDSIFDAGTTNLADGITNTLSTIRSNSKTWPIVPVEFLVETDHSESDWVGLIEALANESIAEKYNESMDDDCSILLTNERADADVSTAISNLDSNGTAVRIQWYDSVSTS